jgi:hypothetical protein
MEVFVKKLSLFLLIGILGFGSVFAQGISDSQDKNDRPNRNNAPERRNRQERPERPDRDQQPRAQKTVTIEGTLQLEKGLVAVASGDSVYMVPLLTRYIGFIEGLKEGTNVSVEGFKFNKVIQPTKITIDGKSYDFLAFDRSRDRPRFNGDNFRPGRGFGPGCGMQWPGRRNGPQRGGCRWS